MSIFHGNGKLKWRGRAAFGSYSNSGYCRYCRTGTLKLQRATRPQNMVTKRHQSRPDNLKGPGIKCKTFVSGTFSFFFFQSAFLVEPLTSFTPYFLVLFFMFQETKAIFMKLESTVAFIWLSFHAKTALQNFKIT